MFPGDIPGRSRLELLGRSRGRDRVFRNGRRRFVTKVNHFYNGYPISHLLGAEPTLTRGIVSSPQRIREDTGHVQIDADVNPGNSGGPLIDRYGQVIGVNTSGYEQLGDRIISGINFAIASNEVGNRLEMLEAGGPSQATYRNLRHDYKYSMNIPKGWYLGAESGESTTRQLTFFDAYGGEREASIRTFRIFEPFVDINTELDTLAGFFWNRYLLLVAEDWEYFEKGPAQPALVNIGGNVFTGWNTVGKRVRRTAFAHTCHWSAYPPRFPAGHLDS